MIYTAIGGLGDFLQMATSAINVRGDLIVASHSDQAETFFNAIQAPVRSFIKFDTIEELQPLLSVGTPLKRTYFDYQGFSTASYFFTPTGKCNKQLIIHPFGSNFSLNSDKKLCFQGKDFPVSFIEKLVYTFYSDIPVRILGSPEQLKRVQHLNCASCIVKPTTIWEAIIITSEAYAFVGADSFLKTARCMYGRMPFSEPHSYTLIEKKSDPFRDVHFILPYEHRMKFLFFENLEDKMYGNILDQIIL